MREKPTERTRERHCSAPQPIWGNLADKPGSLRFQLWLTDENRRIGLPAGSRVCSAACGVSRRTCNAAMNGPNVELAGRSSERRPKRTPVERSTGIDGYIYTLSYFLYLGFLF